jgi:HSP20 family protein
MMDDWIRRFHSMILPSGGSLQEILWRPAADVYQCPKCWLVKLDLAGVRLEDVDVSIRGRSLIVQGCRRDAFVEEGFCHYHLEIAYSRFERRIELPWDLESAEITTEYRDGMLLIRIEKESNHERGN